MLDAYAIGQVYLLENHFSAPCESQEQQVHSARGRGLEPLVRLIRAALGLAYWGSIDA